jgi:hypothetical protein
LSGILSISDGSVKTIIKQRVQYLKVCALWILHLLTDEHEEYTAASGAINVTAQAGRGPFIYLFIYSVVTVDETWLHYFIPRANVLQCSGITQNSYFVLYCDMSKESRPLQHHH